MLDHFIRNKLALDRLRSSPFAAHLDRFAAAMVATGYCRETGYRYLDAAGHLGQWCTRRGIGLQALSGHVVTKFIAHLDTCSCPGGWRQRRRDAAAGARGFLEDLHGHHIVDCADDGDDLPDIVRDFCAWMRSYRGVTTATLRIYAPLVAEFVLSQKTTPAQYDARSLRAFVIRRARGVGSDRARCATTAMRMFITFLASTGRCRPTLVGAVPAFTSWRLAKLPRYMAATDIERIIGSFDTTTPLGARNQAIVLLMARLGLRTAEVASLRIADLHWSRGRLSVVGKGGIEGSLPLPQDVGDAILRYLANRLPSAVGEYLFVRSVPPKRPLAPRAISEMFSVAARSAGIKARFVGAHVLRHSLATNMLADGACLEQIGAVLRHRSMETTCIYAKVDVSALRRIARPWPLPLTEVAPC
jgi:site-specific recombinase XerD